MIEDDVMTPQLDTSGLLENFKVMNTKICHTATHVCGVFVILSPSLSLSHVHTRTHTHTQTLSPDRVPCIQVVLIPL